MNKKPSGNGLIYLYCVSRKKPKLIKIKRLASNLYSVKEKDLWAVVSRVSTTEFSEEKLKKRLADFEWVKGKASLHEKIIEGVMASTCVIPFKFATLFSSEDNLKGMLRGQARILKENLRALEGKEEWGIKIYCDKKKLRESLFEENEMILKINEEISSSSPGRAFLLKKKKEELLNAEINRKINEYGRESFYSLREQCLRDSINKLLPKEVTEREEDMILNSTFLLDKKRTPDFIRAVENLRERYGRKGFLFDCTGPWPPYNFCQSSPQTRRFLRQKS